jgi:hypothetical protein
VFSENPYSNHYLLFSILGKSPARVGGSMGQKTTDPELERLKTKNEQHEIKLKQASDYITYQDNQIVSLNNSIEEMKTQADASAFKRSVFPLDYVYYIQ